jgi:hypothetical protein
VSDFYDSSDFPEEHAAWLDDLENIYGEPLSMLVEWSELGLPEPEHWSSFNVDMDDRGAFVDVSITDDSGIEYSSQIDVSDLELVDTWDWVWEMWDWIAEQYSWVDEESSYSE